MTSVPAVESDPIGAHAGSVVRHARSNLVAAVVVSLGMISYEPVSTAYLGYSVGLGGLLTVLTLVIWRRRSGVLSVLGLFVLLQLHLSLPARLGIPQMCLSGALVSCSVFLLVLSVARRQICRWCRLAPIV